MPHTTARPARPARGWVTGALTAALVFAGAGLASARPIATAPHPAHATQPARATAASASARSLATAAYARMTPRERVGQLFLLGVPSTVPSPAELRSLHRDAAGNVYLAGTTHAGVRRVHHITAILGSRLRHDGVAPFIGTDQEGGEVQRLHGPGFSAMPTALRQGGLRPPVLRRRTQVWGQQLRRAGLNLNLAPVAATVPAGVGARNQPIGRYYREFGHTVHRVRHHVYAAVRGWQSSGIAATVKHFPGLGRASGNTDTDRYVTDPTRAGRPYLLPYRAGIAAGAQFVMVSSAVYPHIAPHRRACFSYKIIHGLLRDGSKFHGIVVSDSFSAASIAGVPPRLRATRFLRSGGTMILDSSPAQLHPMAAGVLQAARADPHFAAVVKSDVLRVLTTKARDGLIR